MWGKRGAREEAQEVRFCFCFHHWPRTDGKGDRAWSGTVLASWKVHPTVPLHLYGNRRGLMARHHALCPRFNLWILDCRRACIRGAWIVVQDLRERKSARKERERTSSALFWFAISFRKNTLLPAVENPWSTGDVRHCRDVPLSGRIENLQFHRDIDDFMRASSVIHVQPQTAG